MAEANSEVGPYKRGRTSAPRPKIQNKSRNQIQVQVQLESGNDCLGIVMEAKALRDTSFDPPCAGHPKGWPLHRARGKRADEGGASFGFGGFQFAIARRGAGFERAKEAMGCGGDFVDGEIEGGGVGFRWLVKAGDLADELKRSGANLVGSDGRIKVEKGFDAAAHFHPPEKE